MITKTDERSILPLDMNSIITLLEPSGGTFAPLHYDIHQPHPDLTEIHLDIHQCDPDSIDIQVHPSRIDISADASFNVQLTQLTSDAIHLNRHVSTSIPLPSGISLANITSEIKDETYIVRISHNS